MPQHLATWNEQRDVWEAPQGDLFSGLSDVYSAIWPRSGMTRSGAAYAHPTSEPHTSDSASSSSPTVPTPSATEGERGPKDLGRAWDPANQVTLTDWGAAITAGVIPTRTYPRPALHSEPPLPRP